MCTGSYQGRPQQTKGESTWQRIQSQFPKMQSNSFGQGAVVVLGRLLSAVIFLMAGANHFNKQTIGYAASQGVPLASIAVPLSGVLAILGGLSLFAWLSRKT
jgi:hypothetical protein